MPAFQLDPLDTESLPDTDPHSDHATTKRAIVAEAMALRQVLSTLPRGETQGGSAWVRKKRRPLSPATVLVQEGMSTSGMMNGMAPRDPAQAVGGFGGGSVGENLMNDAAQQTGNGMLLAKKYTNTASAPGSGSSNARGGWGRNKPDVHEIDAQNQVARGNMPGQGVRDSKAKLMLTAVDKDDVCASHGRDGSTARMKGSCKDVAGGTTAGNIEDGQSERYYIGNTRTAAQHYLAHAHKPVPQDMVILNPVGESPPSSSGSGFPSASTLVIFTIVAFIGIVGAVAWVGSIVHCVKYVRKHYLHVAGGVFGGGDGRGYSKRGASTHEQWGGYSKKLEAGYGGRRGVRVFSRSRVRKGLLEGWKGVTKTHASGIWPSEGRVSDEKLSRYRDENDDFGDEEEQDSGDGMRGGDACGTRRRSYDEEVAKLGSGCLGYDEESGIGGNSRTSDYMPPHSTPIQWSQSRELGMMQMQLKDVNEECLLKYGKPAGRVFMDGLVGSMKGGTWLRGLLAVPPRSGRLGNSNLVGHSPMSVRMPTGKEGGAVQLGGGEGVWVNPPREEVVRGVRWSRTASEAGRECGLGVASVRSATGAELVDPGCAGSGADGGGGGVERSQVTLAFRRDAVMRRALNRAGGGGGGCSGGASAVPMVELRGGEARSGGDGDGVGGGDVQ